MKKLILKCFAFSFYFSLFPQAFTQTVNDAFHYALELYKNGKYEESAIELERVAFFSDSLDKECYLFLAKYHTIKNDIEKSGVYYDMAYNLEKNDSIRMEIRFNKIHLYLEHNQPVYSLIDLNTMQINNSDYFTKKKLFYLVLCQFISDDYKQSEKNMNVLSQYFSNHDSLYLSSLFKIALKNNSKNTSTASMFSIIIPGLGQVLNGAYLEGINSFLLNAILISAAIITMNHLSFLDAFLSFFQVIKRYYLSGIFISKRIAEQKKSEKKIRLYNELLDYINNEFQKANSFRSSEV